MFESLDPSYTMAPFEVRHPFVDLRLLRFLLAVPAIPWCRSKYLLRSAMKGVLPEPVRLHPKAVLGWDPVLDRVRPAGLPPLDLAPQLRPFINPDRVESAPGEDRVAFWINFRPRSLDYWLKNSNQRPFCTDNMEREKRQHEYVTEPA